MSARPGPPESADPAPRGWLEGRDPPVPEPVRSRLEGGQAAAGPSAGEPLDGLLSAGLRALGEALAGEGARRGAFRLLAADAYLTYACEAALHREDAAPALLRIVAGVVAEAEGRGGDA